MAFTVKKPATTIMTTATAKFDRIMLMDEIHPLSTTETTNSLVSFYTSSAVSVCCTVDNRIFLAFIII